MFTARNAQVVQYNSSGAGLLQLVESSWYQMRSHGLHQLVETGRMQVSVNRLAASCSHQTWRKLLAGLLQTVSRLAASCSVRLVKLVIHNNATKLFEQVKLQQVCKWQVATSLTFTSLLQLDEINKLVTTVNLQQVCGVSIWLCWWCWLTFRPLLALCLCHAVHSCNLSGGHDSEDD